MAYTPQIDALAELGTWLCMFIVGAVFGVWWARASWERGFKAAQSAFATVEQHTLERMSDAACNEYVRAKRGVPRKQWRV